MTTSVIERIVYEVDNAAGASGTVLCIHGGGHAGAGLHVKRNPWYPLAAVAFVRESLMRQDPEGYACSAEALAASTPADVARITCPTLLVTGDQDVVAPPQAVRHMGEKIAGAQVEVLSGCGHWTPVERPDACVELLRRFQSRRVV